MSDRVGLAVIGCGGIAKSHLDSLRMIDDFRIVATVDIIEERAREYASGYEAEKIYTSIGDAIEDPEVEGVSICLPPYLHCPAAVEAAEAGKHILVEKPMAISLKETDLMIRAADKNGVVLMVEQTLRFRNCNILAKKMIKEGAIGDIFNAVRRRLSFSKNSSCTWSCSPEKSGGWLLYGFGSHEVDIVLWLLDAHPVQVSAYGAKNNPYWNDYDEVSVQMRLDNTIATVLLSLNSQQHAWDATIIGEKGSMLIQEGKTVELGVKVHETPLDPTQGITAALKEFARSIRSGDEPEASGRRARDTMLALEAAKLSIEKGRTIYTKDLPTRL